MASELSRQKLQTVSDIFLFQNVDDITVERIIEDERCTLCAYGRGDVIFDEATFVRSLGVVLSGEVGVEKNTPDGKRMKMSVLGAGECFGAAAMFNSRGRYATVLTAEKPTEILFLPQELITWAMSRNHDITENYIAYLSDRIWFLNDKISTLSAGSTQQRLAMYLLDHKGANTSMTDLCSQLNIGRASLYRALDDLEGLRLIARGKKSLEILDENGLRQIMQSKK